MRMVASMIILMGNVQVQATDAARFLTEVQTLARTTRAREGCLFYPVATEDAAAGRMLVVERWRNQASLTAHLEASDTVAFVERWSSRMVGSLHKFDAISERSLMD
jgi:quinol monooxygenase YgiN